MKNHRTLSFLSTPAMAPSESHISLFPSSAYPPASLQSCHTAPLRRQEILLFHHNPQKRRRQLLLPARHKRAAQPSGETPRPLLKDRYHQGIPFSIRPDVFSRSAPSTQASHDNSDRHNLVPQVRPIPRLPDWLRQRFYNS